MGGGGVVRGEEGKVEEDKVKDIARKTESGEDNVVKREECACEDQGHIKHTPSSDAVPVRAPCDDIIVGDDETVRDPDCTECSLTHPDPTPDQLIMYLHALRYTVSLAYMYVCIGICVPLHMCRDLTGSIALNCHLGQGM